jgi:acetyltransferase-like isoleucine patch superfamily enzyme
VGFLVGIREFIQRMSFWLNADRIGPDFPLTHWKLHFKSSMRNLCNSKFKNFGTGAEFRPGAYAEACSKISIGNDVVIRAGTYLFADPAPGGGGITIEDSVLIGPGVHFYTNNHEFSNPLIPIFEQGYPATSANDSILVRKGCWIGAGVIILPGVEIGENSVIGAGTVVTKSVPPRVLFLGNPGKTIRSL